MANILSMEKRVQILHMLCEGQSIRGINRITGVAKNTITKLLVDTGKACRDYHDQHVRNIRAEKVQCDEIWSFVYAKQKNTKMKQTGDAWVWTALDAASKMVISYLVGDRGTRCAMRFMKDTASRLTGRPQITTDGHSAYLDAVEEAFGADVDYAQLVKVYATKRQQGKIKLSEFNTIKLEPIQGNPDRKSISTSYVERQNFTMRMHMRRFCRYTNAFSKKMENHMHAVAIHFMYYNFVKIHSSLRTSPAMAAGVTGRLWNMKDLVELIP